MFIYRYICALVSGRQMDKNKTPDHIDTEIAAVRLK